MTMTSYAGPSLESELKKAILEVLDRRCGTLDVCVDAGAADGSSNSDLYEVTLRSNQPLLVNGQETTELIFGVRGNMEFDDLCRAFACLLLRDEPRPGTKVWGS
jgi:hypothetical protein